MKKKKQSENIILASNRKAQHDYFILEKYEAGIVLSAGDLKSCLDKHISLSEGYISIDHGQLILYNVHINRYKNDFWGTYNVAKFSKNFLYNLIKKDIKEDRPRILLMHKKEILAISNKVKEHGVTIIPLSFYQNKTGLVKVEIALVKGKHNYDKRESIKEKELSKELKRYGVK